MINEDGVEDLEAIPKSESYKFKWTAKVKDLLTYVNPIMDQKQ